jgi:hypothetical protein
MIFLHHWYDYQKCRSKAFRKVDFGYPQQFAAFALKNDDEAISDYFIPRC